LSLLVVASLLSSATATWFLNQQKLEASRLQDTLLSLPAPLVLTSHSSLSEHLAALWSRKPMLFTPNSETVSRIIQGLRQQDIRAFLFVLPQLARAPRIEGWKCQLAVRHRGRHLHYLDTDVHMCSSFVKTRSFREH
jgi:hypothetical protein